MVTLQALSRYCYKTVLLLCVYDLPVDSAFYFVKDYSLFKGHFQEFPCSI